MSQAHSWSAMNKFAHKFSQHNLTTATWHQKSSAFNQLNPDFAKSPILPQSNYFGSKPKEDEDPFLKRKVKQLNDVDLIEDKEPEEITNLKRLPSKILTEENLVRILSTETEKLNLENHYWLGAKFLAKLGMIAPNLLELSLRRMSNITNMAFAEIFKPMKSLVTADFSDCTGLHSSAVQLLVKNNPQLEDLQLSGCHNAVDDVVMHKISSLNQLTFLDISYAKQLTDNGLICFKDKQSWGLQTLIINGVSGISSQGLGMLIQSCSPTLQEFEGSCLDQPEMKNDFLQKLGQCWSLEFVDISGCSNIEDQGILFLVKGEVQLRAGLAAVNPGLIKLSTLKAGNTKMTDHGFTQTLKQCPNLVHLEVNSCDLTEDGVKNLVKEVPHLKFLDLSSIAGITLKLLEEIKTKKPDLLLRQYRSEKFDAKDNGLRVPRRVIEKEKKKGKKKKK